MVVAARQSFQFFRQMTWFLGNDRAWSKFKYRILNYLISIIKSQIKQETLSVVTIPMICSTLASL